MVRNWKLDIYRYQLQRDHLPMAAGKHLDIKRKQDHLPMVASKQLDIYRYQLQQGHLPMAAATGNSIFTDIEENWAIYRWHLHLGRNKIFVVIPDETFTDDFWGF